MQSRCLQFTSIVCALKSNEHHIMQNDLTGNKSWIWHTMHALQYGPRCRRRARRVVLSLPSMIADYLTKSDCFKTKRAHVADTTKRSFWTVSKLSVFPIAVDGDYCIRMYRTSLNKRRQNNHASAEKGHVSSCKMKWFCASRTCRAAQHGRNRSVPRVLSAACMCMFVAAI